MGTDGCAIVLDAVEWRRGSEVKRGEGEESSGFLSGDAHQDKYINKYESWSAWCGVGLSDLWMTARLLSPPLSLLFRIEINLKFITVTPIYFLLSGVFRVKFSFGSPNPTNASPVCCGDG